MIETQADMWSLFGASVVHVITTNGSVRRDGACVMGRGCALEARDMFIPSEGNDIPVDVLLGKFVKSKGNHVHFLGHWVRRRTSHYRLVSFPVKHRWSEQADLKLIQRSAVELVELVDEMEWSKIVVPRPGCGNGHLKWQDVKPTIEPLFDDRFIVVHK